MRLKLLVPLLGFVVPTIVIGYGFVIPRSCIAGVNELTVGFGASVLGAAITYVAGIRLASGAPHRAPPSPPTVREGASGR